MKRGPFHVFKRIREFVIRKLQGVGEGLTCEWCNSVWFGTAMTIVYYFAGSTLVWIMLPLALSAFAVVVKHMVQPRNIRIISDGESK
jgi:hypothetical protein